MLRIKISKEQTYVHVFTVNCISLSYIIKASHMYIVTSIIHIIVYHYNNYCNLEINPVLGIVIELYEVATL